MSFGTTYRRSNPYNTMCLKDNLTYADWLTWTSINAAMHTHFASVAISS
jgi:hypothetical protein